MTDRLSAEQVAALSDAELSEHVARVVFGAKPIAERKHTLKVGEYRKRPYGVIMRTAIAGAEILEPGNAASFALVMEHMRQRWRTEPRIAGRLRRWQVEDNGDGTWSARVISGFGVILREHFASSPTFGNAIFQCAILSAQEMGDGEA